MNYNFYDFPRKFLCAAFTCLLLTFGSAVTARAGFLYVLSQQNAAANQIYGYRVNETTGELTALNGFPIATGGNGQTGTQSELLTIDRVNKRLYVANRASNTISAFSININGGGLTPLPFSPFTGVTGQITLAVHPTGSPLVVGGNSGISNYFAASYNITATTVAAAAGSPFSTGGARPFSSVFTRDGNYYYTGGALSVNFAGFSANSANGVLTTLAGSPYPVFSTNNLGFATDSQGRLFAANRADQGLRVYITASGVPTQVSASPFATTLTGLTDGVLSVNELFYLVLDSSGSQIGVYRIQGSGAATTLNEIAGSPFPTNGSTSNTIALNQTGNLVFTANSSSRSISSYVFDQTTGNLSGLRVQPNNTVGTTGFLAGMDYIEAAPTTAGVSVSGRITPNSGRLFGNTLVTATDSQGTNRAVVANPFGYFKFESLTAGETYVFTVNSKRYNFAPQILSVNDNITGLNFTELP